MNIIFLGPAGSGKRIQSNILKEDLGYNTITSIDILQNEISSNTNSILKEYINKGELVPDLIMDSLIQEELFFNNFKDKPNGFIFDGYPRTLNQAKSFNNFLKKFDTNIDHVFCFSVNENILIERSLIRGERTGREDDLHEETIINKIKEYNSNIQDIKNFYKDKIHIIDGNPNINIVTQSIKKILFKLND